MGRGKIHVCSREQIMIPKVYREAEVAAHLHRSKRWLSEWLLKNPIDRYKQPLHSTIGHTKRFTGDQIVQIIDMILTQEEDENPRPEAPGWVYFVDGGEHIKIGYTRSIEHRLKRMGTDLPTGPKVLLMQPGTFKTEKILHRHFSALRVQGEWFRKGPELLEYIEQRKHFE
jgi:hypothetical protein